MCSYLHLICNVDFSTGFVDSSGLRFYYSEPRKYDSSVLEVAIRPLPKDLIIPPKQSSWLSSGYCSKRCTKLVRILCLVKLSVMFLAGRHGWSSCKISAFRPQAVQFNHGPAEIWIFVWFPFPPKLTQLSILP